MKKILLSLSIFAGLFVTSSCDLKEDSSKVVNPYDFFTTTVQNVKYGIFSVCLYI